MAGIRAVTALLEELTLRTGDPELASEDEDILRQKLNGLGQRERILLERSFYRHEWNAGSATVIRLLSQVDLFSMPIYLVKLESPEEQQNIFNDLIETEHYLLSDLIKSSILESSISMKLRDLISDGIRNLLEDLTTNPEITVPNYLNEMRKFLNQSEMDHILGVHLTSLLQLNSYHPQEAVAQQLSWHTENMIQSNVSILGMAVEICYNCEKLLSHLLTLISEPSFTGWKYGLGLLNLIISLEPDFKTIVKKHIPHLFTAWISKRNERSLHVMMLMARQLSYASGSDRVESYRQWYKYQIAEINYTLKSKDDFQYALKSLTALVPHEQDPEFLQVHMNTPIPAPPYCKVYVNNFREASKKRALDCAGDKSSPVDGQSKVAMNSCEYVGVDDDKSDDVEVIVID